METTTPFSVVAVVQFGNSEALVLNRPLNFVYERIGRDFLGSDGPFRDYLYYQKGSGSFIAFAGRELELSMADGTVECIKDHWWSGIKTGCKGVIVGSVEGLKKCYVFSSASIIKEEYEKIRSSYSGCVYPYWDYEKVIKYDDMRMDLWRRLSYQEQKCRNLIKEVRKKHSESMRKEGRYET